jgi:hypothetical protein
MELGPILRFDLIRTARRARTYAMRAALGATLVGVCWLGDSGGGLLYLAGPTPPGPETPQNLPGLVNLLFIELAGVQGLAILALVPGLMVGSIVEDDRGGALAELLASPLSSRAIVLGKLGARLAHVAAGLAAALPLVAPLGLMGILDPGLVVATYGLLAMVAIFTASLSLLVACVVRSPRHAVVAAYLTVVGWLLLPWGLAGLSGRFPAGLAWLGDAAHALMAIHPVMVAARLGLVVLLRLVHEAPLAAGAWSQVMAALPGLVASHAGISALFVVLACALLRPLRVGGPKRPRAGAPAAPGRPAVGDDPMLWKEWYGSRGRGRLRFVVGAAVLVLGALMAARLAGPAQEAFREWRLSWSNQASTYWRRERLNGSIRELTMALYLAALGAVAASAATSVTGERERGTWTSLETTLLTGREVVRAKVAGALRGVRWVVPAYLVLSILGLATGAVHPLGFVLGAAGVAVFLAFATALGVACSVWLSASDQALVTTLLLLLTLNVFPLLFVPLSLIGSLAGSWATIYLAGVTPLVEWSSLISAIEIHECLAGRPCDQPFELPGGLWRVRVQLEPGLIRTYAASLGLHLAATLLLLRTTARRFDVRRTPARPARPPVE